MNEMELWAELLKDSPYVAIILGLGFAVVYLYRRKEAVQAKYTEDLVKATGALQDLTAEYLKQSFADSANWQDRYKSFEDTFKQHASEDAVADQRLDSRIAGLQTSLEKHEVRIKEHIDLAVERINGKR
jgi:hypothetical protein